MQSLSLLSTLLLALLPSSLSSELDDVWRSYLSDPPQKAVSLTASLQARADTLADSLSSKGWEIDLTNIDVVCSGGGNYDAFYAGVQMMISRLGGRVGISRYAGVSAGGMFPFEVRGLEIVLRR